MKKIEKKSAAIGLAVTLAVSSLAVRPVYTKAITEQTEAEEKPIVVTEEAEAVPGQAPTVEGTMDALEADTLGAADASGVLEGSFISWTYTAENQKLTFTGEGPVTVNADYRKSYLAYSECVREIEIEEGITSVGSKMFSGFQEVEIIMLPDTVTRIGDHAFEYCKKLKSIEIPSSISYIGSFAFLYAGIEKIEIPESIKELETGIFDRCAKLQEVILPDTLTRIDSYCFSESGIKEIVFPESLVRIDSNAFEESKLEEVVLPDSVTTVGNDAFGTDTLKKVTVGKGLKSIGFFAFGKDNLVQSPYEKTDWFRDIEGEFEMFGPEESVAKDYAAQYNIPYNGVVSFPQIKAKTGKVSYGFPYHGTGIKWDMPYRATGYYIYRSTKKNGAYKKIATLEDRVDCQFVDATATLGKTYYYKVSMYHEGNGVIQEGEEGSAVAVKGELAIPDFDLSYSEQSGTPTIKCTWYSDQRASKFYIYRSTKKKGTYKLIKTKKNKWTTNEAGDCICKYTDTNITKGTKYFYKIKAYTKVGTKTYTKTSGVYGKVAE